MTSTTTSTLATPAVFPPPIHKVPSPEFILAENTWDREQVYKLRYRCYRSKQSIDHRDDERFHDRFDLLPNAHSFLVRSPGEESLATVRINVVIPSRNWTDSPVQQVYGDHPKLQEITRE